MNMSQDKAEKVMKLTLPPLITAIIMLLLFALNGMYPFGEVSIAWSDGIGQFIPLLDVLKDVLDGRSSLLFNFQVSGGTNFFGIFFYYLSSPFNLLVKFVDKENVPGLFNVLVMLKMAAAAFAAAYCFSVLHRNLRAFWVVLFSLIYAFSGYVMMYYLIVIWLDLVYLFPLLILGLHRIVRERKPLMYLVILACSCLVNYYLTYMLGIFVLLFLGIYLVLNYRDRDCSRVCRQILLSSLGAFLIAAAVWLPSFMQYQDSARGETTAVQTIAVKRLFLHNYETSLPLLMAQALPWVLVLGGLVQRLKRSKENNLWLLLLILTVVPFIIEPVNLLWHTGNYMCFPCRFSFITVFLALLCSAYVVEEKKTEEERAGKAAAYGSIVVGLLLLGGAGWFVLTILNGHISEIGRYVRTLWADAQSFKYMGCFFAVFSVLYGWAYRAYCRNYLSKRVFYIFLGCIFFLELLVSCDIYFVYCAKIHESSNRQKIAAYDLCGRIEDDEFYRVKSRALFHSDNCIGSLGYNSISSYTSLNDRGYMETMKRLGYSGAWMGLASYGGTELTDALLSIKYEIDGSGEDKEEVYKSPSGSIARLPYSLPMGVYLKKGTLEKAEYFPEKWKRMDVQRFVGKHIVGENIVRYYYPEKKLHKRKGYYTFKKGTRLDYKIRIDNESSLYLDIYDHFSTRLNDPLFNAAEVRLNGKKLNDKYPIKNNNGFLRLGTYRDETAAVSLRFTKDVKCRSFGIFGLDVKKLLDACQQAQGADLRVQGSGLYGKCYAPADCSLFVSLPYRDNFVITINGERVSYRRAFSDFIVFDIPQGENEISISYIPRGLALGVCISCAGLILSVGYVRLSARLEEKLGEDKYTKVISGTICAAVCFGVYILPVLIKLYCLVG